MNTHGPHLEIDQHGLQEGCERCEELARKPWLLDTDNIARIAKGHIYSDLDGQAGSIISQIIAQAERFEQAVWT